MVGVQERAGRLRPTQVCGLRQPRRLAEISRLLSVSAQRRVAAPPQRRRLTQQRGLNPLAETWLGMPH